LTVLDVFFHDPLYKWTISPSKIAKLQNRAQNQVHDGMVDKNERTGAQAQRILARLQQKLEGFEGGHHLSVKGQVARLVNDARDPQKLCRLYHGWAPWV
jgi:ataxia telangiectasia mutated family protein